MGKLRATGATAPFVILVFVVPVILAQSFEGCVAKIPSYETYKHDPESLSYFAFSVLEKFRCTGEFIHVNADAIIAVFTVVLAVATIRLWVSTNRLWEGAEKSSERQLRAYVLVEAGDVYDGSKIGIHSVKPEIKILHQWTNYVCCDLVIKNSGQTPAKRVRHWAKLEISSAADEHTLIPPVLDEQQASVIAPGSSVTKSLMMLPFPMSEPVLSEVISGKKGIYVVGKIAYEDSFGRDRTSVYRLRYAGPWPPMPSGTMNFALHGNDYD